MSAPLQTPYLTHIEECKVCLQECLRCLEATSPEQACHRCLHDCVSMLKSAIRLMAQRSVLASRYLVDCAEVCAECARCCGAYDNPYARRCVKVCQDTVACCRRGSFIDV